MNTSTQLTSFVNDFSFLFSQEQLVALNSVFAAHEKHTTEQVVTVLFPSREWRELFDIAKEIFEVNGIGQKNTNNGLLLVIATDEKKIRIMTGKGMETRYSEMRCRDIIENHLRPLLNAGKLDELVRVWGEIVTGKLMVNTVGQGISGVGGNMDGIMQAFGGTLVGLQEAEQPSLREVIREKMENPFARQWMGILVVAISLVLVKFSTQDWWQRIILIVTTILLIWPLIMMFIGWMKLWKQQQKWKASLLFGVVLFFSGLIVWTMIIPTQCQKIDENTERIHYACQKTIGSYVYHYTRSESLSSHSSSSSSSSDYYSSSISSSFDGGGGSSNGGGFGD